MNTLKKYIVLEGIERGNRFYTTNAPNYDHTKLLDGTVAYKILGYADSGDDARKIIGPIALNILRSLTNSLR